jgi:hypothetical protein
MDLWSYAKDILPPTNVALGLTSDAENEEVADIDEDIGFGSFQEWTRINRAAMESLWAASSGP